MLLTGDDQCNRLACSTSYSPPAPSLHAGRCRPPARLGGVAFANTLGRGNDFDIKFRLRRRHQFSRRFATLLHQNGIGVVGLKIGRSNRLLQSIEFPIKAVLLPRCVSKLASRALAAVSDVPPRILSSLRGNACVGQDARIAAAGGQGNR